MSSEVPGRTWTLRVARIVRQTPEVIAIDLVHPRGLPLPAWTPGAHVEVHTPGGFSRTYSLAEAAPETEPPRRWRIGVKREPASRGGSAALHERVREGDLLAVGAPRNAFPMVEGAREVRLVAGGIGLTPLLAMAEALARRGDVPFTLAVFARSAAHVPFADALAALGPRVRRHLDEPAAAGKIALPSLVEGYAGGAHLYLCGPAGFMQAVRAAAEAAGWPDEAIHVEYFAPPDDGDADEATEAFTLHLARRGITVPVAAGQSAIAALHDLGIEIPTSCEQGVCGTCVVPWLEVAGGARPEHRDFCLTSAERRTRLALCRTRAARGSAGALELDL